MAKPTYPMITNLAAQQPPTPPRPVVAPELDDAIKAIPLVAPDFTNPKPKNSNVALRWIEFKARDGFRFHQALSQGYVVATANDLMQPDKLAVYNREMGTKFINGDVILMKIDRARYLGALKHRHQQSDRLTAQGAVQAASRAAGSTELSPAAMRSGKMEVFTPGADDAQQAGIDVSKIPGIGGTPGVEKGTGNDIRSGK